MPPVNSPNFNKIYKIRPFLNMANKVFQEAVEPEIAQSIDEQMIVFTGKTAPYAK